MLEPGVVENVRVHPYDMAEDAPPESLHSQHPLLALIFRIAPHVDDSL